MSEHVSDQEIAESVKQAEVLLTRLDLSEAERRWAREQAKVVFKSVTDALFKTEGALATLRGAAAAAAIAYAMVMARDWSDAAARLSAGSRQDDGDQHPSR